jgi:hypothetical protein
MERMLAASPKEYIKAKQELKVSHMCQFLKEQYGKYHANKSIPKFQVVYHAPDGEEHVLNDQESLETVLKKFKMGNRAADLVLHYKAVMEV